MSRFLDAYEAFVRKATDTPLEFGHAAGLTCLSTIALGRRRIDRGNGIKPNLFLMLTAGSSKDRKSTNVQHAKKIITDVEGDRLGPEDFTAEGLVFYMRDRKSGKSRTRLLLPIEEFGGTLAAASSYAANLSTIFCKLYDGESFERVRSGKRALKVLKPRLSVFGAVAYGMLEKYVDPQDWVTGFFARFLFIEPITRPLPYPAAPPFPQIEYDAARAALLDLRNELKANPGAMAVDPAADAIHRSYVTSFPDDFGDPVVAAQRERYLNTLWKLAMLYQIDEKPSADIGAVAMQKAIDFGQKTWDSFNRIYVATSGSPLTKKIRQVWKRIDAAGQEGINKRELMRRFHLMSDQMVNIVDTLLKMTVVRTAPGKGGLSYVSCIPCPEN